MNEVKEKQSSMIAEIQANERELLDKVNQDPKRWNSKNLDFENILSEVSAMVTNLNLDFSTSDVDEISVRSTSPHESSLVLVPALPDVPPNTQIFQGPFNPVGFEIVGEITCYQKFDLNFEMKIDKLVLKGRATISYDSDHVTWSM